MAVTDNVGGPWDTGTQVGTWQCGSCLAWVPSDATHSCQPTRVTVTWMDLTAEDRIASALERIAAALEVNAKED